MAPASSISGFGFLKDRELPRRQSDACASLWFRRVAQYRAMRNET
jgi:hypothetical protein